MSKETQKIIASGTVDDKPPSYFGYGWKPRYGKSPRDNPKDSYGSWSRVLRGGVCSKHHDLEISQAIITVTTVSVVS